MAEKSLKMTYNADVNDILLATIDNNDNIKVFFTNSSLKPLVLRKNINTFSRLKINPGENLSYFFLQPK